MKVYYFTVVAIGIMFLLNIGGVETNSSQIIGFVSGNNPENWLGSALWIAVALAIGGFVLTTRVSIGGFSYTPSIESVMAVFIGAVYTFFASDLYSVVTKIGSITNNTGWTYWIAWAIIVPLLAGYSIAVISFVRGTD